MFKYYSSYVLVFSGFTHLLCCGLPVFLSLSSLFTNLFYIELTFLNFELIETTENYLFILTTLIFIVLISQEFYNRKIKCADNDCCSVKEHNYTKNKIKFNLILSSILYIINSILFLSEKIN